MYNWKYNLNITYRHRKTGIETKKTIVLSRGEESSLENILRITFGIPKDEGILLNCSDTIFYPVSMVNLEVAANAPTCELQSFSLAALNNGKNSFEFFLNVSFFYVLFLLQFNQQLNNSQFPKLDLLRNQRLPRLPLLLSLEVEEMERQGKKIKENSTADWINEDLICKKRKIDSRYHDTFSYIFEFLFFFFLSEKKRNSL
jgi:hypothetical protein